MDDLRRSESFASPERITRTSLFTIYSIFVTRRIWVFDFFLWQQSEILPKGNLVYEGWPTPTFGIERAVMIPFNISGIMIKFRKVEVDRPSFTRKRESPSFRVIDGPTRKVIGNLVSKNFSPSLFQESAVARFSGIFQLCFLCIVEFWASLHEKHLSQTLSSVSRQKLPLLTTLYFCHNCNSREFQERGFQSLCRWIGSMRPRFVLPHLAPLSSSLHELFWVTTSNHFEKK